jgi:hypothetical protein
VTVDAPDGLLDRYKVADFKGVVQNVTLSGPPEVVDLIDKPGYPQPKARLVITPQDAADAGTLRSKVVQYDLPPGWQVSDEDRKKTIEFRLVDRSTAP